MGSNPQQEVLVEKMEATTRPNEENDAVKNPTSRLTSGFTSNSNRLHFTAFEHNSMKPENIQIRRANSEDLTLNQSFLQGHILMIDPRFKTSSLTAPPIRELGSDRHQDFTLSSWFYASTRINKNLRRK